MSLEKFIKKLEDDSFYYSDYDFVTNSQLGLIKEDVRTYKALRDNPHLRPSTQAMSFGRAYHVAMLEPNEFGGKVDIVNASTRGTKVFKDYVKANPNLTTIILQKEYDRIMRMQEVLFSHNEVCDLLDPSGETEMANAWRDNDTDVFCKGKGDYRKDKLLVDLKTTQDASMQGFGHSCRNYGYDRQASFYMDGFDCEEFVFIAQEKTAPYNVSIYYAGKSFLERGRSEYKYLLDTYRRFFIDNEEDVSSNIIIDTLV